jgi:hypothetical protein
MVRTKRKMIKASAAMPKPAKGKAVKPNGQPLAPVMATAADDWRLYSETSPDVLEQIELRALEWQMVPDTPTSGEQRQMDLEEFEESLLLAESTKFTGGIVLAFGDGYLRMMEVRDAAKTFDYSDPNFLGLKI